MINSNEKLDIFTKNIIDVSTSLLTIQNVFSNLENSNNLFLSLGEKIKVQTSFYSKMEPNLSNLLDAFKHIDKISTELEEIKDKYNNIKKVFRNNSI